MSDHDPPIDPTRADLPPVDATQALPATPAGPPPSGPPPTDGPEDGPDRRWWLIGALLGVIVLIGLAALLLGGDDDDPGAATTTTSSSTTTSSTTTTTSTTTSSTTTTTAPTTTTTAPPSTVDPARCVSSAPDDPDTTALVVWDAFAVRDAGCAANLMTSDARDQLFALQGDGSEQTFAGCFDQDEPDPHTLCAFTYEGGSTALRLNYSEVEGWTVYEVFQQAD